MEGILYYKNMNGKNIPIAHLQNCNHLLDENSRNEKQMVLTKTKSGYKNSGELQSSLEMYKQKTLYLLAQGTEFLIKDDD